VLIFGLRFCINCIHIIAIDVVGIQHDNVFSRINLGKQV
jgi:hypothetical protein